MFYFINNLHDRHNRFTFIKNCNHFDVSSLNPFQFPGALLLLFLITSINT